MNLEYILLMVFTDSMAASSEAVLLYVNNVRCKKVEGTLYVFETRIAWQQPSKDIFSISHNFADIKSKSLAVMWLRYRI